MILRLSTSTLNCSCGAFGMVKDFITDDVYCVDCWGEYLILKYPDHVKKRGQ